MYKWAYDVKRGLRIECKCPQKPDSVLRKQYGEMPGGSNIGMPNFSQSASPLPGKRIIKPTIAVPIAVKVKAKTSRSKATKAVAQPIAVKVTAAQKRKAALISHSDSDNSVDSDSSSDEEDKEVKEVTKEPPYMEELRKLREQNAALIRAAKLAEKSNIMVSKIPAAPLPKPPGEVLLLPPPELPVNSICLQPPQQCLKCSHSSSALPSSANEALCNLMFIAGCDFQKAQLLEEVLIVARRADTTITLTLIIIYTKSAHEIRERTGKS